MTRPKLLALLTVLALAGYCYWPDRDVADHCHADAPDYIFPALHALQGRGFIHIENGVKYPPAHPIGLSVLLVPVYALLGTHPGNGVYLVYLFALGATALTFWIADRLFGVLTATVACLLLMAVPEFRYYGSQIAPDGAVLAVFCLVAYALAASLHVKSSRWKWFALGSLVGASLLLRADNILLVVPVALIVWVRNPRPRPRLSQMALFAVGLGLWVGVQFACNRMYTGDWFRPGFAVTCSPNFDRPEGLISWRHFLTKPIADSNALRILNAGQCQFALSEYDDNRFRCWAYRLAWIPFAAGVWALTRERSARPFLWWTLLLVALMIAFFGCAIRFETRYIQRAMPFVCVIDAAGLVWLWGCVHNRWIRSNSAEGLVISVLWLLATISRTPYMPYAAYQPYTAYFQHVASLIHEPDALIVTTWGLLPVENLLVGDTHRTLLRAHSQSDPLWLLQWKKPPHPEWITEDTGFLNTQRYRRMRENGAVDVSNGTAENNPQVIDDALMAGRAVYYLVPGLLSGDDVEAFRFLNSRYRIELLEKGFAPARPLSAPAKSFADQYLVLQLRSKTP
ncbi:MAG: glycosyltransferase family 39 protein [Verrucomicrobiia bacterium]